MERKRKVLEKLIIVYIKKGLTFRYTTQTLNLFNSHLFSNTGLIYCFFFNSFFYYKILKYFNTHTHTQRRESLKEIDSGIYLKVPN